MTIRLMFLALTAMIFAPAANAVPPTTVAVDLMFTLHRSHCGTAVDVS